MISVPLLVLESLGWLQAGRILRDGSVPRFWGINHTEAGEEGYGAT